MRINAQHYSCINANVLDYLHSQYQESLSSSFTHCVEPTTSLSQAPPPTLLNRSGWGGPAICLCQHRRPACDFVLLATTIQKQLPETHKQNQGYPITQNQINYNYMSFLFLMLISSGFLESQSLWPSSFVASCIAILISSISNPVSRFRMAMYVRAGFPGFVRPRHLRIEPIETLESFCKRTDLDSLPDPDTIEPTEYRIQSGISVQ